MTISKRVVALPAPLPTQPNVRYADVTRDSNNPEIIARQTTLMQFNRLLYQLSCLSQYANEFIDAHLADCGQISGNLQQIQQRLEKVHGNFDESAASIRARQLDLGVKESRRTWEKPRQSSSNFFTPSTENLSIKQVYDECDSAPNLSILDSFRSDGESCMKFYSYPQFFHEEWEKLMEIEEKQDYQRKKDLREQKRRNKQRPTTASKVQAIHVQKYDSEGALVDEKSDRPSTASGRFERGQHPHHRTSQLPSVQHSVALNKSGHRAQSSRPGEGIEQYKSRNLHFDSMNRHSVLGIGTKGASGTLPPPAPAPPPPPPPPPPSSNIIGDIAPKAAIAVESGTDEPINFLADIRGGQFKLKKVDTPSVDPQTRRQLRSQETGVAAILMRRVAMEMSDSDDDDDDDDDDEWV